MSAAPTADIPDESQGFLATLNRPMEWVRFGILLLIGVVAALLIIFYLSQALRWQSAPFLGVMVDHTMTVTPGSSTTSQTWTGHDAGLQRNDRITEINGVSVVKGAQNTYLDVLNDVDNNGTIAVSFIREVIDGEVAINNLEVCQEPINGLATCSVTYTLENLPDRDFFAFFGIPFFSGLVVLATGGFIVRLRLTEPLAFTVAVISALLAICMIGLFDISTTHTLIPVWIIAGSILTGLLITVALTFPIPVRVANRLPILRFIPIIASLVLLGAMLMMFGEETAGNSGLSTRLTNLAMIIGIVFLAAMLFFYQRPRAIDAVTRDQANTVFIGVMLALMPSFVWVFSFIIQTATGNTPIPFSIEAYTPFMVIAPISLAYAVLQYRHFDTDRVISQGITYTILALALIIGYFLLVLGVSLFATDNVTADDPLIIALAVFIISALFIPVRTRLQNTINEIYFRTRRDYQRRLEDFSRTITTDSDRDSVLTTFRSTVEDTIQPTSLFLFLRDPQTNNYVPYGGGSKTTDIIFSADSGVVDLLTNTTTRVTILEPDAPWEPELRVDRTRLSILQTSILAGLGKSETSDTVLGFVCVGRPRSGTANYNYEEVRFVNNLVSQASSALERAQVIASYEQRVSQLNVLSQVSQAVNFIIEPDDLLELIVTQTERLIQSPYFYIVLLDDNGEQIYFAFFLEDDDRDPHKEQVRWAIGNDMYSEVIQNSRAIRVNDYGREMTRRNYKFSFENKDTHAWMGVPLIASTGTLGVMAVGEAHPDKTFSDELLKVFSDIGALAATALYQSRLFTQANVRARQLGALNEVSRQLVAAEENIGELLELITNSAVEILIAEAGSLLLVAEDGSGDLEFRAVAGGTGGDLLGNRLESGYGIVGKVASTGEPIIANDTTQDERFEGDVDAKFMTSSLLAVPLQAKEGVIGVLEVINKQDGTLFDEEDQELLTTFAGQAAIALENARLFEKTDQALQLRVQELEDLQQFSQELSRSLDIRGVAEITVRGAMERSNASAALLAVLNEDESQLFLVNTHGYEADAFPPGVYEGEPWEVEKGIIKRVLRTRQPDLSPDVSIDPDYLQGIPNALSQITLPMMSGDRINAILVLEKDEEPRFNLLDQASVMRISEQASIAIANALLYEQVASANDTKSEFVGFAAHELKNPLASVKGYADLLFQSKLSDTMSEEQKLNFVGVIRSNANRMQSIIDDLRDIARMDADKFQIEPEAVNLRGIVNDTLMPFQAQFEDRKQTVVNSVDEDLPPIWADSNKLIQVMTNFVSNAHKYSPPEATITVDAEVRHRYINRHNKNLGRVMEISVSDTGIGMSEEDLGQLFKEDYFRSSNEKARSQKGTGLGMIITKRIIEGHGGEVWVESEIDQGTTFRFVIPLAATNPIETQAMSAIKPETEAGSD